MIFLHKKIHTIIAKAKINYKMYKSTKSADIKSVRFFIEKFVVKNSNGKYYSFSIKYPPRIVETM